MTKRRGRRRADGSRVDWESVDPVLEKFIPLRETGDLPLPRGRGRGVTPKDGDAPSYGEIARAINDTTGQKVTPWMVFWRIRRHHRSRQESE